MWIDIAALGFVAVFAVLGYVRGLFSQAWSLGALIVSFFAADPVLRLLRSRLEGGEDSLLGEWILKLVVGLVLYVGLLVLGFVLEKLLVERFKLVSAGNRVLGATLGVVKGGIGLVLAIWLATFFLPVFFPGQASTPDRSTGQKAPAARDAGPANVGASGQVTLNTQLASSRVAGWVAPYNPLNLLLLARVKPYLPSLATGRERPPVKPPRSVEKNEVFKNLLADGAFIEAYRSRSYLDIIRNPSFHQFVQDRSLLDALERSQH